MRKVCIILCILILASLGAVGLIWISRASVVAQLLSRHLDVPVTLRAFDLRESGAYFTQLWIGNPARSRTKTSFSADTIEVDTTFTKLRADPLLIEEISIRNILVGIENYNGDGTDTNWSHILKSNPKNEMSAKDYLIKTLILENLTVEVTSLDGKTKRYPTIARLEFHNIGKETGFPIGEIEKAIFKLVMQDLIKQLNLKQLLQGIQNMPGAPPALKYLPNLFGN